MYKITILSIDSETLILTLETENRFLARSVALLCKENGLKCEVVREVVPVPVTFKGV